MANDLVLKLDEDGFEREVILSKELVLVDFWAPWCGPCRMIAPHVEDAADKYAGKIKVCKVNVDEQGPIAAQYGIMSIPTLMVFKGGKQVDKMVGASPKALEDMIGRNIT